MKGEIINESGSMIALLYVLLIILAVDEFDWAGVINSIINFFGLKVKIFTLSFHSFSV